MIGQAIEGLKNPKNWWSWILAGWVLCIIGYLFWHKVEPLGKGIAGLGLLAIIVTLVRLCVTKVVYTILVGIAVFGYLFWYSAAISSGKAKSIKKEREGIYVGDKFQVTRKRPKYGKGVVNLAQQGIFAPAFMTDTFLRASKWGAKQKTITQRDTTYSELKEGGKALLDRKKKGR